MKKDCIIWGAGYFGNKIMESVLLFGYKIIAYCDKNVQLSGKNVGEYPIISIEEAKELCRKSNGIDIIIAIKNKGAVQNVEEYVVSEFPKNTKVVYGEHIYDQIQERRLLKAYEKIKYTWTVSMANQFKQWIENIFIKQNNWIAIVSIIIGLPLGFYLTDWLFKTAIEEHYDFCAFITIRTYIIAAIGTFIVSYLVSKFLARKIKKIDMVTSLKGNE